jgi:GxxExxY protein
VAFDDGEVLATGRCMDDCHDQLTERIIGCAMEVHRRAGPGLLESIYDVCLAYELQAAGLDFERHLTLPFEYKTFTVKAAFKVDFVVERRVLVEIKAVETLLPVHKAQALTYMKLARLHTGLLFNFNVPVLRDGIRRLIWTPPSEATDLSGLAQ